MLRANVLFQSMCEEIDIKLSADAFVYFIDFQNLIKNGGFVFDNFTPDYTRFLNLGLNAMKYSEDECTNKFCHDHNIFVDSIGLLVDRICNELVIKKPLQYDVKLAWFSRMKSDAAIGFAEALQRVLFVHQLMWQCGHVLVGLGRLDMLLEKYYKHDVENGILKSDDVIALIKSVYYILHEDYQSKSNMLFGDTGQNIILGGTNEDGAYVYNDLTILFMQALMDVQLPDPVIHLRVSKKTPRNILELAAKCIATGIGSPLLANDDVIIPQLLQFGISDALDYTSSACWEPMVGGCDTSVNNMFSLNFLQSLDNLFMQEPLPAIKTFEQFKDRYFSYLAWNINEVKRVIEMKHFQYCPIISVFMGGCFESKKDVSYGGATYHDFGITTYALANTINALLNIRDKVFIEGAVTLVDVKKMIYADFNGYEQWLPILRSRTARFGNNDAEIINLTNEITRFVSECTKNDLTYLGGRIKFGLCAPFYVDAALDFPASFDGRKKGEPFNIHISNDNSESYTEIVDFASALDYSGNRFNGNTVDIMMSPEYVNIHFDKFVDFISQSIEKGFFQMQMNVVSSSTLLAAMESPDKYSHLIVRVWGFSAYFNEIPYEYKDAIVQRVLRREQHTKN